MDDFEKYHREENGLLPKQKKEKSTWELMKETASTPEEKQDILDTELKNIKEGQHYKNKSGEFENDYGQKLTPVKAYAERVAIRKSAAKFIKDREQLNRFVRSKSYSDFKEDKTFERILDRIQKDK